MVDRQREYGAVLNTISALRTLRKSAYLTNAGLTARDIHMENCMSAMSA